MHRLTPDLRSLALLASTGFLAAVLGCSGQSDTDTDDTSSETSPTTSESSSTSGTDESAGTDTSAASSGGETNPGPASQLADRVMLGGISLKPGLGWTMETPSSSMRVAQYTLPGTPAGADDGSYVITYFGQGGAGAIQANLDRWVAQVTQPDGTDSYAVAEIGKVAIDNMAVVTVDVTGNFAASVPRPVEIPGARLMVWVVQSPVGPFFIKVVGPEATVDHWEESLRASYRSILSTS